ncbi:hypothetical protein FOXG_21405 [Fusarium oxysporum f. sp. lycopersici 4287]|uniref:F-box domain-containing protein n=1 Tax=Fusarium oxysporum f. sp. lycopersici (strain 4287 / CBS 123668 / FGSC 9935 / NRRL 34936) TaxID=426428 RepID=A0A0J9VRX6_FUSO4|nr:hypothetical protein FOXG_20893 [Fusarium oxysporum f. sp. lycopersici 4287]XP_018253659.1 hypothetical protein FOXG_21405 [Fusarium oxysporum f. sp. lycopersici 4287]EWZ77680.1 hypothetical protein FOWG_17929 [Fusarium oxysporum f. sp. lycopersici MN25]KAJ9412964.1 hypothetical protein QL093DRAFT_2026563 [Fusarium oxysporum]KNB13719.1 hypothetical protein FOXG_20893 [Fusarium oxysporum f. sp. lycopersici 4287]KNB15614.1 hypothetical protein FOXG_21405 [Fusarium oxysporum f. sp. lycopersici
MSRTRPPAGVVPKEGLPDKMTLPNELYLRVLGFLETNDLLRLERVSTHFRGLVMDSYKTVYGSGPCHRVAKLPSDYRRLAIEQLQYKEDVELVREWEPSTFTCRLFDDVYFHTDEDIHKEATEILLFLQGSTSYGCAEWSEAVAVALIAQARYTEAAKHFAKSNMEVEKLHENRFLAAARFGWSPELGEKPQTSTKSCMDKGFVGMACHGDLESMKQLIEKGVRLDITIGYNITAARVAKIHGHDHILKFLHEHGVDLLS